jgi:MFS superfamily sulfate permease-like transporter
MPNVVREESMNTQTLLIVILLLLLVGALPTWPYSSGWGYYPSGGLALILVILIVLAVSRRR